MTTNPKKFKKKFAKFFFLIFKKFSNIFMDILSAGAGEVAVRVRKKSLRAGADNNNIKMVCAVTAY